MTKTETVNFVELIWATWPNNDLTATAKKTHYEAWHRMIHDLPEQECLRALDEFVLEDKPWPPRPGGIRRRVIDRRDPDGIAPTPVEAWAQYQKGLASAVSGADFTPLHPVITKTLKSVASSSERGLHTNADRNIFTATYEENLRQYEVERYLP